MIFGVNTIDRIINNLLSYTRPKTIALRKTRLSRVVKETLDFMSVSVGSRDIQINFDSAYDADAWFDPDLIKLCLMNFISNAIEAIADKGYINVMIGEEGDYASVIFNDSGAGMSVKREGTYSILFSPRRTRAWAWACSSRTTS